MTIGKPGQIVHTDSQIVHTDSPKQTANEYMRSLSKQHPERAAYYAPSIADPAATMGYFNPQVQAHFQSQGIPVTYTTSGTNLSKTYNAAAITGATSTLAKQ